MNEEVALNSLQQQKNVAQIIWNSNINIKCKPENVAEKKKKLCAHTCVLGGYVCVCVCVCVSQLIVWSMKAFACFAENSIPLEIIDTSSHEFNLCGKIAYALVSCVVFCSSGIYILLDDSQVSQNERQTRNNDSQMKKRVLCSTR